MQIKDINEYIAEENRQSNMAKGMFGIVIGTILGMAIAILL